MRERRAEGGASSRCIDGDAASRGDAAVAAQEAKKTAHPRPACISGRTERTSAVAEPPEGRSGTSLRAEAAGVAGVQAARSPDCGVRLLRLPSRTSSTLVGVRAGGRGGLTGQAQALPGAAARGCGRGGGSNAPRWSSCSPSPSVSHSEGGLAAGLERSSWRRTARRLLAGTPPPGASVRAAPGERKSGWPCAGGEAGEAGARAPEGRAVASASGRWLARRAGTRLRQAWLAPAVRTRRCAER